jgi:hypothetical protein
MFFVFDGGHSRVSGIASGGGGASLMFFALNGGRSQISVIATHGARCRHFFRLMVGAPGCSASPPRASPSMFFALNGGTS